MRRVRRHHIRNFQPYLRAVMVISAVTILATGVTFAALQSQEAVLSGNTIQTATADLKISTTGTSFYNSRTGFAFNDVVPGAVSSSTAGNTFYLKNSGSPALTLRTAINSTPVNTDNVDFTKVYLVLSRAGTSAEQKFAVADLMTSNVHGGLPLTDKLNGGHTAEYTLRVVMDADAFTGQDASIGGIDMVFSGVVEP